jgi:hypothetical protein|tara:strand:- start:962 stop:1435 length:474 start_codon:yes stop_codon:yes gene_type:complete
MVSSNALANLGARGLQIARELGVNGVWAPTFSQLLVPTYVVDPAASRLRSGATDASGTGTVVIFTVADDEVERLYSTFISRGSGDRTLLTVEVFNPAGASTIVEIFTAASSHLFAPVNPIPLGPGWGIQISTTGGSVDSIWVNTRRVGVVDAAPGGI